MANEMTQHADAELLQRLDTLLARVESIDARLDALQASPTRQLDGTVALALAGMTDEMLTGLVRRLSALAEVALDPGILELLDRMHGDDVQDTLRQLTDPATLETMRGLVNILNLMKSGLTDEMVAGLVRKIGALGELILDPFVLDALERLAGALKAGQAEYPGVKVPPVGGIFAALRSANDADTRRVMSFALAVMRNLGHEFS